MSGGWDNLPDNSVEGLARQILELRARVSELERPTGTQVAESVATLDGVIASQLAVDADTNAASNFALTGSASSVVTVTLDVPDGFTQALVMGVGSLTMTNFSGTAGQVYARVRVANNDGQEQPTGVKDFNTSPYSDTIEHVSCSHALKVVGLTPGGTFTVVLRARTNSGTFSANVFNVATLSAQAVYLR